MKQPSRLTKKDFESLGGLKAMIRAFEKEVLDRAVMLCKGDRDKIATLIDKGYQNTVALLKKRGIGGLSCGNDTRAKLSHDDVRTIRTVYKGPGKGPSVRYLGAKYGVTGQTILNVIKKRTWRGAK